MITWWTFEEDPPARLTIDWRSASAGHLPFSRLQQGAAAIEA